MSKLENPKTNRVAGVILAAGASVRMGQPKLLLPWQGKPIIQYPVIAALGSGLDPVLVVTGKYHDDIEQALANTPVTIVRNYDWQEGQSSSVRRGIQALPKEIQGAVFLLGDQPLIPARAISMLIDLYLAAEVRPLVLAPMVDGKRANPVLFDNAVFPSLLKLSGDAGARQIFTQFPPLFIEMNEPGLLFDIDSPEDLANLNQQ